MAQDVAPPVEEEVEAKPEPGCQALNPDPSDPSYGLVTETCASATDELLCTSLFQAGARGTPMCRWIAP